jgi:hypothetical protein
MPEPTDKKLNDLLNSLCKHKIYTEALGVLISNGIDEKTAKQMLKDNPSAARFIERCSEIELLKANKFLSSSHTDESLLEKCPLEFIGGRKIDFTFEKTSEEIANTTIAVIERSSSTHESLATTSNYSDAEVIYSPPKKTQIDKDITEVPVNQSLALAGEHISSNYQDTQ